MTSVPVLNCALPYCAVFVASAAAYYYLIVVRPTRRSAILRSMAPAAQPGTPPTDPTATPPRPAP